MPLLPAERSMTAAASVLEGIDPAHPQAAQMADPAMIRTLRFQAEAAWPQESRLYARYALPAGARILDLGCGTGEATRRLSGLFPGAAEVIGVDPDFDHATTTLVAL